MPALVSLVPATVAVTPGDTATCSVRLRNTGEVVDQFSLAIVGDAAAWATLEPSALRLFPGAEEVAIVRFSPPGDGSVGAGEVPFGVRVTPQEDPGASVVEEGAVTVAGFTSVGAEMVPRNVEGRGGAVFTITVANHGNTRTDADVGVEDPDNALAFALDPPRLTLEPGVAAAVKLRVRAPGRSKVPRRCGFRAVVSPTGVTPIYLDGSYTEKRKRRVVPLAIAAAILVVLAVVAVSFLRPKVQSTAQEFKRIAAQVEAAQEAVANAEEQIEKAKKEAAAAGAGVKEAGEAVDAAEKAAEEAAAGETTTTAGSASGSGETGTPAETTTTQEVAAGSLSGDKPFGTSTASYTCTMAAHESEDGAST